MRRPYSVATPEMHQHTLGSGDTVLTMMVGSAAFYSFSTSAEIFLYDSVESSENPAYERPLVGICWRASDRHLPESASRRETYESGLRVGRCRRQMIQHGLRDVAAHPTRPRRRLASCRLVSSGARVSGRRGYGVCSGWTGRFALVEAFPFASAAFLAG